MYIRIQNNSIRFRVSVQEAELLVSGAQLKDSFIIPNQNRLDYSVTTSKTDSFEFHSSNHLELKISENNLKSELSSRPNKKGIKVKNNTNNDFFIYLEIDIKRKK